MKNYFLALLGLAVISACNNTPTPAKDNTADGKKPVPPPAVIDSTAKADSILNLHYTDTTWKTTMTELSRWDSCAARQTDSSIAYIQGLPKKWFPKRRYMAALDTMPYKNIYAYAKVAAKAYEAYRHPPVEQLVPADDGDLPIMVKKPVIYLYPTTEQHITVKLGFKGSNLYTWPKIKGDTWRVTAKPDGMLTDSKGGEYPYLFWEGICDNSYRNLSEGFVVKGSEVENFLTEKLKILGLNARERTDFITYWAPIMVKNAYNFVRFETSAYTQSIPLTITPVPESVQRILMVFKPVDEDYTATPQTLVPFIRKGYTVIEWGGTEAPITIRHSLPLSLH